MAISHPTKVFETSLSHSANIPSFALTGAPVFWATDAYRNMQLNVLRPNFGPFGATPIDRSDGNGNW